MKNQKSKFLAVKLARAAVGALSVALLSPVASAQTAESIFANTYVTGGASAVINGDVLAGTYLTTGASAIVTGDAAAATITTLGASASVGGALQSGLGNVFGAGATAFSDSVASVTTITATQAAVMTAQSALNALAGQIVVAPGNIATDFTFTPGVYKVTGLKTVTADKTIFLDAAGLPDPVFIFNISNYLTFGAGVNVKVINNTHASNNVTVTWNAGGYISIGAKADIVGTVLAHTYVSTGAYSVVSGPINNCGAAICSATSYVSVGAFGTVGTGDGCEPVVGCECNILLVKPADFKDPDTVSIVLPACGEVECGTGDFFVVIGPDDTGDRKRTRIECGGEITLQYYDPCDTYYEVWLYRGPREGDLSLGCDASLLCAGNVE